MRTLILAVMLSGCGAGAPAEVYALVIDFVMTPASCMQGTPLTNTSMGPLSSLQARVWDGPEGKAYLSLTSGAINADMGDAPNVTVTAGQALEGTAGPGGWTFVTERTSTTTAPITMSMTTTKTRAALSFPRAGTARGTLSLSSSLTCTGTNCTANMPTCTIDGIGLRATRLQVAYETSP